MPTGPPVYFRKRPQVYFGKGPLAWTDVRRQRIAGVQGVAKDSCSLALEGWPNLAHNDVMCTQDRRRGG